MLTVKSRDGQTLTITLADNFGVSALVKKTVADIKTNDYIASTGLNGADGKLHCVELRIFPDALRGVAEGQLPWDAIPDSTMTNATVTGITEATGNQLIKVSSRALSPNSLSGPSAKSSVMSPGTQACSNRARRSSRLRKRQRTAS